ncbi:protein ILITYHIA-like, partial [Primulina huaijiensis]|uniref:protein ILITYHIA-like n=1 Tax=Primulina huaijiensis TaxID=1492673 RepID=UPI003CC6F478
IFCTPEGMLSSERGVYVAESVVSKNVRQAKGRFRIYDNDDSMDQTNTNQIGVSSNHSTRRGTPNKEVSGAGKKDLAKSIRKPEKTKTAKEEAREVQLREEGQIREKVVAVQQHISLMLKVLEEMALANPIFMHSQLPSA